MKKCIRDARKLHYSSKMTSAPPLSSFFSVSDELLGKAKPTSLPSNIPIAGLDSCPHDPPSFFKFDGPHLSMCEPVTEELICRLISQSPTKSCTLGPIPTTLTKQCLHDLAPPLSQGLSMFLCPPALSHLG